MSTLGPSTIAHLYECHIPPAGGFYADMSLETGALPAIGARLTLAMGDLSLVGTVTSSAYDLPDQPRVLLLGGAGWSTPTAAASFQSAGGVRLSTVLRTLAMGAGNEPYDAPPEAIVGQAFGWPGSTPTEPVDARAVLAHLVRRKTLTTWRVAPNGRTRFDAWPKLGAADTFGRIKGRNLSVGARRVALDTHAAAFLPGATLEGVTIRRVIFREKPGELRCEAYDR